jgi:Flp pilus assembly protein CpaB
VTVRRLVRSPVVFWVAVAALAVVTGSTVARLVGEANAAAARYGTTRSAAIATRAVGIGARLEAGDVEIRTVPVAFLPEGTLGSSGEVAGRTVLVPLVPGQAVLRTHVAPTGLQGVAALLPPGTRGVSVPVGPAEAAPVQLGDTVDVLATFDPSLAGEGDPTFPVATSARVVAVGEEAVTVAVTPDEAARVAYALAQGVVTLVVSADPSPARPAPQAPAPPDRPRTG